MASFTGNEAIVTGRNSTIGWAKAITLTDAVLRTGIAELIEEHISLNQNRYNLRSQV
jgi:NAD(P)-dependent dehydrogenase (short-subunit alcohol dehydrogenase family)